MTLVMDRKPREQILEDAGVDGDYQGYHETSVTSVLLEMREVKGFEATYFHTIKVLDELYNGHVYNRQIEG